jgi:hypothetical protein
MPGLLRSTASAASSNASRPTSTTSPPRTAGTQGAVGKPSVWCERNRQCPTVAFYRQWDRLTVPQGMAGVSPLDAVETRFGCDSGVADTMRTLPRYADIYGTQIPAAAATHLETRARLPGMAVDAASNEGITEDEAEGSGRRTSTRSSHLSVIPAAGQAHRHRGRGADQRRRNGHRPSPGGDFDSLPAVLPRSSPSASSGGDGVRHHARTGGTPPRWARRSARRP